MSGPAARPEREDVLASIRRLVSRDLEAANKDGGIDMPAQPTDSAPAVRAIPADPVTLQIARSPTPQGGARPSMLSAPPPVMPPTPDRAAASPAPLVLTPAHRVPGRIGAAVPPPDQAEAADGATADGAPEVGPLDDSGAPRCDSAGSAPLLEAPAPEARAPEALAPEPEVRDRTTPEAPALDEGLLRALIADVVREELAGETGRRITSNLRKLVRAEIARAMASRDLL